MAKLAAKIKTKQNSQLGVKEGNLWTISALFPLPSSTHVCAAHARALRTYMCGIYNVAMLRLRSITVTVVVQVVARCAGCCG
jgi:hypothetical protein